jgi:hypothetical protein
MTTKAELVAYGQAHGVAVDDAMLKADIEQALRDAGHDPDTLQPPLGEASMTDETTAPASEEAAPVSRNAAFSTYREATGDELDNADDKVPPGRHVVQELGEASE